MSTSPPKKFELSIGEHKEAARQQGELEAKKQQLAARRKELEDKKKELDKKAASSAPIPASIAEDLPNVDLKNNEEYSSIVQLEQEEFKK